MKTVNRFLHDHHKACPTGFFFAADRTVSSPGKDML